MHPPSDITPGDEFVARVFNAIVTGPQWAKGEVLLLITFDEHGGCYDHVAPPLTATRPDNRKGEFGFDFKRFGVRVPAVVVSPFVKKGSVFHAAAGAMPYDHTSILATIERRFRIANLTKRDAAAPDLDPILTEALRTDAKPLTIAAPKAFALAGVSEQKDLAAQPLNDLQRSMVEAMRIVVAQKQQAKGIAPQAAARAAAQPVRTVGDAQDFFRQAKLATGL